jgi:hypothetical protein
VLCAADGAEAAWEAWRRLRDDQTAARLAALLPFPHDDPIAVFGRPGVVRSALAERPDLDVVTVGARDGLAGVEASHLLVPALAASPDAARVPSGAAAVVETLHDRGTTVWLVAPVGTVLPARLYAAVDHAVVNDLTADAITEPVDLRRVDRVAGPTGLDAVDRLSRRVDCPVAPELLRLQP